MNGQVIEVARREIVTRARTKGFRVITGILVLLAIAAPVILSLLPESDGKQQITIGITEDVDSDLRDTLDSLESDTFTVDLVNVDATTFNDPDALDDALRDYDVVLSAPATATWSEREDPFVSGLLSAAAQQVSLANRADEFGLDPQDLAALFEPVELQHQLFNGDDTSSDVRSAVAFFGLFTAFVLPQTFGQLTMLSVVEEKSTRVVEVLLSHVRPQTLLTGKILGLAVLAIAQLLLILAGLVGALWAVNVVEIPSAVWRFVPLLGISVLGGLLIYTTLFALLGSLISRQEDSAQVMMPVFVPLMAGYIVGQSAIWGPADGTLIKLLTWFPLTTPMILPVRVARDAIGTGEVVLALALLALAVLLLIKLASRLYEFTLLRTGARVSWREALSLSLGRGVA